MLGKVEAQGRPSKRQQEIIYELLASHGGKCLKDVSACLSPLQLPLEFLDVHLFIVSAEATNSL